MGIAANIMIQTSARRLAVLVLVATVASTTQAQQDLLNDPPSSDFEVRVETIATGINGPIDGSDQYFPTDVAAPNDGSGRLFIMTLGGVVRIIDENDTLLEQPWLDVTNPNTDLSVPTHFGMTAIELHPDFARPGRTGYGRFYTIETELKTAGIPDFDGSLVQVAQGGEHHDVLYEYTARDHAAPRFSGTRRELMRVEQPGWNHNLADLVFDHDGMLCILVGDGSNAGPSPTLLRQNAQELSNIFGSVLRIDPLGNNSSNGAYGIPSDNPYVSRPDALDEIWCVGLRAPWRICIDAESPAIYVADVGQQQVEEVNRIRAAGNYGWPWKEGSFQFDQEDFSNTQPDTDANRNGVGDLAEFHGLDDPHFQFDHQTGRAVAGGVLYRGDEVPDLHGLYIFGDTTSTMGGLCAGDPTVGPVLNGTGAIERITRTNDGDDWPSRIISVGQDADGEILLLGLDGLIGTVHRVRFVCVHADPCRADLDCSQAVDVEDLLLLLGSWGSAGPGADLERPDDVVDVADLLALLGQWGGCDP